MQFATIYSIRAIGGFKNAIILLTEILLVGVVREGEQIDI
jgi:hypothetical protein